MITGDDKLLIFTNFVVDQKLRTKTSKNVQGDAVEGRSNLNPAKYDGADIEPEEDLSSFVIAGSDDQRERARYGEYLEYLVRHNPTMRNKLKLWFANFFVYRDKKTKNVIKYETIENFFVSVKNAAKDLNLTDSDLEFYTAAVKEAEDNGQQALFEILKSRRNSLVREIAIAKRGKDLKQSIKIVDEEDIVKFFKAVENNGRFLKLTWIKNYVRLIPETVIKKKNECDELGLFDNYVVLHFDKAGDASQMTKKEKEKANDPILFGVIRGSRKLYFVGDWIDEYCDLTLNKFLEVISQEKPKTLTVTSIKQDITSITEG